MSRAESHPSWVCGLKLLPVFKTVQGTVSHPSWVCGLKRGFAPPYTPRRYVTPFVGVWIETCVPRWWHRLRRSHPSWVCGLKRCSAEAHTKQFWSHPSWVCGLKHNIADNSLGICRHTLRGCVD